MGVFNDQIDSGTIDPVQICRAGTDQGFAPTSEKPEQAPAQANRGIGQNHAVPGLAAPGEHIEPIGLYDGWAWSHTGR